MKNIEKWQRKYNMTPKEWEEPYFKELIGGMKVTQKEKEKSLLEIEKATLKNFKGNITRIKKEDILKSYPNSINLLKLYYKSLIYAYNYTKGNKYQNYSYYDIGTNKTWEEILLMDRNTMLMIYTPYLERKSLKEREQYAKEFDISLQDINDMISRYRSIFPKRKKDKEANEQKRILIMAKKILKDIASNNCTKKELAEKYNVAETVIDECIESLKEIDNSSYNETKTKLIENEEKRKIELQNIISNIYDYIGNGIEYDGKRVAFTTLDYYSVYNNTQELLDFINDNKENKEVQTKKNRVIRFLTSLKNIGLYMTPESFASKKIRIILKETETEFNQELSEKLINYLTKNGIPTNYEITYTAAKRYARGETILPLKEKVKLEGQEKSPNNCKTKSKKINS